MPVVESAYPALIQGVSQQHPSSQLPGQVLEQLNMLSDPVTGPRRRPGAQYVATLTATEAIRDAQLRSWVAEIGGVDHLLVLYPPEVAGGNATLSAYSMDFQYKGTFQVPYLACADTSSIDIATLRGDVWILNREKQPALALDTLGAGRPNPSTCAFFWVKSAAFSKTYSVSVEWYEASSSVRIPHDFSYTTPDGTHDGDAALSTPAYIAGQLQSQIQTASTSPVFAVGQVGAFVSLRALTGVRLRITQQSGDTYMGASGSMSLRLPSDLPSNMASAVSESWTVSVGTSSTNLLYYRWDSSTSTWIETCKWGDNGQFLNMPMRLRYNASGFLELTAPRYEARLSGDEDNNPSPAFIAEGIPLSGISSYQGRLVLLAGNRACLSDSTNATVFTRSTVTNVVDSDYIEVGSGSLNSATFQYATQYNKDLLLWSAAHQAVLPGGSAVLTPRSAYLVSTGTAVLNLSVEPQAVGRWMLYSSPASSDRYGIGGLYPSDYSSSQYILAPLTDHLPGYFDTSPRFFASSGNSGMAVLGSGTTTLWVYQYLWQGAQLVQSAWHKWVFQQPVQHAYFYQGSLYLLFTHGRNVHIGMVQYRQWDRLPEGDQLKNPFLDLCKELPWSGSTWTLVHPATDALTGTSTLACPGGYSTDAAGEPLATTSDLRLADPACEAGLYWLGQSFESSLTPTPPVVKDQLGHLVDEDKIRLLSYSLTLRNSGEILLRVVGLDGERPEYAAGTMRWAGKGLQFMQSLVTPYSLVQCPVHTRSVDGRVQFVSNSTREMNITNVGYKLRTARQTRRI